MFRVEMTKAEAIERAAMAIHATFAMRSKSAREWSQLKESLRASYRKEAQAAVEAIGVR